MKIRKQYTLFVNPITSYAFYGGSKFNSRISKATLGTLYDCTFAQLKSNIKRLKASGYTVLGMKH